jgi:hypothetical protein
MANRAYPIGLQQMAQGTIDWINNDIRVFGVTSSYTYSAAHDFLDDVTVGHRVGTAGALLSKTATVSGTDTILDAADITITNSANATVAAIIIYKHETTNTETTSRLLIFIDTTGGGTPISVAVNGVNYTITFAATGILRFVPPT